MPATRRTLLSLAVGAAAVLSAPSTPSAWEAATTHAGLAEQAALGSELHMRIERDLGITGGLFARLIVPPKDAPSTLELLRRFNPTHGYVPDGRGRQTALGWLAAGAAMADSPVRFAGHHFLDGATGKGGLDGRTRGGLGDRSGHKIDAMRAGETLLSGGMPAPDWIVSKDNPLGLSGFIDQYGKAAMARTPGERDRHLAGALMAAGSMVHALQDLASPSHARVDLRAHLDELSTADLDVGSRLERLAALAYGRLGVPPAEDGIRKARLSDFFVSADGTGLAQIVAQRFYSRYTLPAPRRLSSAPSSVEIQTAVKDALGGRALRFEATGDGSGRAVDASGVCIALYQLRARDLVFEEDDECVLSQLQVLLPLASRYGAGLLDYLFRGRLAWTDGVLTVAGDATLGSGTLTLLWDDARGARTPYHEAAASGSIPQGLPPFPAGAVRVTAIFRGTDSAGEPLVAVGSITP